MQRLFGILIQWAPRFLLIAIGLTAFNLIWFYPAIQNVRNAASILALEIGDRLRAGITSYLETALGEVSQAADEISLEPDQHEVILNRLLKKNKGFREAVLVNPSGKAILRIDRLRLTQGEASKDYTEFPYFHLALEGVPSFGNVFVTPEGEPHTVLAVPVRGLNKIEGVVLATLNLRSIIPIIKELRVKEGAVYVADKQGFLIVTPDITELLRRPNLLDREIVKKVILGSRVADGLAAEDEYENEGGEKMFTVGLPITLNGWGIFFEQPRRQAFAADRAIIMLAVLTSLLGMVILVVIMRGNVRLTRLNETLNALLRENHEVGKILVRRDLELTAANERLRSLDTSKSEFVSVAAHQLRTPLTGIRWTFNTLLEEEMSGPLTPEQKKVLTSGLKATLRVIALVNDLLNVARIEEGRFGFRFLAQPFEPIVRSSVEASRKLAEDKGITLTLEVRNKEIPAAIVDGERISMVLDNIINNAIKYTPPGGQVEITVWSESSGIYVAVKDTGIGIPAYQMDRMFDKFFRAENAIRFQTSGTGLGLYVVKNIVESHGGRVWIESEEGKGTTLTFSLPIKKR